MLTRWAIVLASTSAQAVALPEDDIRYTDGRQGPEGSMGRKTPDMADEVGPAVLRWSAASARVFEDCPGMWNALDEWSS